MKDSKGRNYYQYEVLVRSADGNEGGRHHIIKATVRCGGILQDGVLYFRVCCAKVGSRPACVCADWWTVCCCAEGECAGQRA